MARSSKRRKQLRESATKAAPARRSPGMTWTPALRALWDALAPGRRYMGSGGLALVVGTMLLYGLGGMVYGQLTVFMFEGFEDLPGWVAVGGTASAWCLAAAWSSYLAGRHWPAMASERCQRWRLRAYAATAVLAGITLLLWLLSAPGMWGALGAWPGLAPQSEWLLAPLPWAWEWVLPLARDDLPPWWTGTAVVVGGLSAWFFFVGHRPRAGLACMGLALMFVGMWALGGAVYHYVAGRGLAGVLEEVAALNLQSHPGQRNADTFLWLLMAWFLLALGALLMAWASHIPSAALQRSQQDLPR
ncbi:hypothetical protein PMI14_00702 [Acidovorax sp. CF316]|uniref:hypothetical protein n=1 Tax=Acidovorax sp. CF316 TaxID=1144317 RepID=UPI00026BBE74|nr:hypothetical protein [Acidovorax sp. CF316]EJE54406.1 hypothetical protein PMI14_00702 [Acidovorax sp. CF316]